MVKVASCSKGHRFWIPFPFSYFCSSSLWQNAARCAHLCWKTVTVANTPAVEVPHWQRSVLSTPATITNVVMAGILQRLRSLFHRYPLASNMVICGSLYGSGDISQQKLRGKQLDWKNTGRIAFIAFTMFGPIYFHWYRVLDRIVTGTGTSSVVSKVMLDQFLMGPPCIGIFYVGKYTDRTLYVSM